MHALKSPYSNGYVRMVLTSSLTIEQLQEIVRVARQTATDLAGVSTVPQSFSSFPINKVGNAALVLISSTMPDQLADGIEGTILLNIMAAFRFLRQILDRVAGRVPMKRDEYVSTVISYCNRFSPHFTDALKLRLPVLVKQAMDVAPPMPDLAQRLSRLSDIALSTIATLRDIIGDESYERWLGRRNSPRSPQADVSASPPSDKFGGESGAPAAKEDGEDAIEEKEEKKGGTNEEKEEEEKKEEEAEREPSTVPAPQIPDPLPREIEEEDAAEEEKRADAEPRSSDKHGGSSKKPHEDEEDDQEESEEDFDDCEFDIQPGEEEEEEEEENSEDETRNP